jgi:hypothetical protein
MATSSKVPKLLLAASVLLILAVLVFVATRSSTPEPVASAGSDAADVMPLTGQRPWDQIDDAANDGWATEAFSSDAEKQLKRLAEWVAPGEEAGAGSVASLVSDVFACSELLPEPLETVFENGPYHVQRYLSSNANDHARHVDESMLPDTFAHRNASGLAVSLQRLAAVFAGAEDARFKAKLFQVNRVDDAYLTRQYISISGRWPDRMLEQNATWIARWLPGGPVNPPRMTHLAVERFEQVESTGGPMFADCTEAVLGANESYRSQLLHGVDYWMGRTQNFLPHATFGRLGIAVGDADGDGLDDLYVCQDKGLPNRLFLQQTDGTAVDASQAAGVDWLESSHGALLVDLDGDGDQDLAVAMFGAVLLAENDGTGRFKSRGALSVSDDTMSLTAADFDRDADLDLYVCAYDDDTLKREGGEGMVIASGSGDFVYYDANTGGANSLLRNDGNWQFVDCTKEVGLDLNNRRISYAAAWEDYDEDGDPDLYVANDYGRNNLYRNDGERFTDVAAAANAEDSASGMSVSWADYDRDGDMDIYVANMFSAAGTRIVAQDRFLPEISADLRSTYLRFARGNTLLRNRGEGSFDDVSVAAGITLGRWAWSSNFADLNNDGWEDLVVANGYYTSELQDTGDL